MVRYNLEFLQRKHMLSILLYIYRNGETSKSEIYENVCKGYTIPPKLELLKEKGLITMKYGMPTYISLTDKGRYIASKIDDIEENV